MENEFTVHQFEKSTVIEFQVPSLMDALILDSIGKRLYRLVDEEDRRLLILDFTKVDYISSQAIGIILNLHKKLAGMKRSKFILCGINSKLAELLKITRLDRVLTVRPSQKEAIMAMVRM